VKKKNNVVRFWPKVIPYKHKKYEEEIIKLQERIDEGDRRALEQLEEIMKKIREE
jgi:hypothetical protein